MNDERIDLLGMIERNNAAQLVADRETVRIGPFLAAFHPSSDLVWLNYATPVEPVGEPGAPLVDELRAAFASRRRALRFEFIEALHPRLAAALEAVGLSRQLSAPLMVCGPGDLRPHAAAGITIRDVESDAEDAVLAEFVRVTRRGFDLEPVEPTSAHVAEQRDLLAGGRHRLAAAWIDGRMASSAVLQASAELGGVATLPEYRRRGAAAAVSSHLAARHFAEGGGVVWLSAGDAAAHAVYAKIGFSDAGAVLHFIEG